LPIIRQEQKIVKINNGVAETFGKAPHTTGSYIKNIPKVLMWVVGEIPTAVIYFHCLTEKE